MEVNELRIGNYIYCNEVDRTLTVTDILFDVKLNYYIGLSDLYRYDINQIEPIKLTEDWFTKLKYPETIKEWKGNGQDYQPETSKTKERRFYLQENIYLVFKYWSYRANIEDKWITENSIYIDFYGDSIGLTKYYIHTLQNLYFALTGKELENENNL